MGGVYFDTDKKLFPVIIFLLGFSCLVMQWVFRLNIVTLFAAVYCCLAALFISIGIIFKKNLYLFMVFGFIFAMLGMLSYYIILGADAGFGAYISGLSGFSSSENPLFTSDGSLLTRILGNLLVASPVIIVLSLLLIFTSFATRSVGFQTFMTSFLSLLLVASSVFFIFTMNLRSRPNTARLWQGHDDFIDSIDKNKNSENAPNVLFILMDDLGYGDISAYNSIYETPNIDSIADEGVLFENFYSSYSVCSPARFAALTGRYPYRGYADNVLYPTVNTIFSPLAATRPFNAVEMGANADGMLGDEITIAEVLKGAGYTTGCFGKWHLGDYGEYLPTNQGFDYFYGSHHVNDMVPFYHVREEKGEYEIVRGTDELKDQKNATRWIHEEIDEWVRDVVTNTDTPFFAFYASPWPHAPLFVGDEYKGITGMGDYADCVVEFDAYLGLLFDTLRELKILDNTLIIFTSDNGPALEGSVNELRGGKGLVYDGGQKVPFIMRWDNHNGLLTKASKRKAAATLVDLYPTIIELCGITGNDGEVPVMLPTDRKIDGVSMLPILQNDMVIHDIESPILHMKRASLRSIQYSIPASELLSREEYMDYDYELLINERDIAFKYIKNLQNDNSAFFDKFRKNWLHILNDDSGENYNRTPAYPSIAEEMNERLDEIAKELKENRRGTVNP